jgi:hypothetical protein
MSSHSRPAFRFFFLFWQSGTESTITEATTGPTAPAPDGGGGDDDDDDDECGAVGGMFGRANLTTMRKLTPVPLCLPQIPRDLTRDRTQAAAVGSRRLTA